jgi:Methyltransferase FkbM domain
VAVSDKDGDVVLSDDAHYLLNRILAPNADGVSVPAQRIDTVAAELNIDRIDLVKMNIEGEEARALEGMGALLAATSHVCISCHDFLGMPTKAAVLARLTEHGFDVLTRDDAPESWTRDYVYGTRR